MTTFRRKQIGRASLGFAIFAIIWTTIILSHSPLPALFIILGSGVMGFVFSSMTVEVDDFELRFWFAPRFLGRHISRADIVSATPVRQGWWRGWGVRCIRGGWLYNVSGLEAVEIHLRNGRRVLLGTDRPHELAHALMRA